MAPPSLRRRPRRSAARAARRCTAPITKVERISREAGLFISPVTLQGFRSAPRSAAQLLQQHAAPHSPPPSALLSPCPRGSAPLPSSHRGAGEADFERHGRQLYAQLALLLAGGAGSSGGAAQAASASVYGRAPPPPPHVAQQQALYQQQAQQHYMQQQHVMQHLQRLTQARQLQQHSQLQASRQRGGGGGSA